MAVSTGSHSADAGDGLRMIPLDTIDVVESFNPRDECDAEDFAQLVPTVRDYGVLQPVLVAPGDERRFRLIAGEGRYRAAAEAGKKEIPARVRPVDEETGGVELALIENLVRERLDPVDEARGYQALIDQGLNVRGIARRLPKISQKRISERLAILKLPAEFQARSQTGRSPCTRSRPRRPARGGVRTGPRHRRPDTLTGDGHETAGSTGRLRQRVSSPVRARPCAVLP